ncbi:MAG: alpha-glucan phosphorylase, partial [Clostridia bacterium]|nr:alpha-glucan phosphorylase [Clostridia bacterium]
MTKQEILTLLDDTCARLYSCSLSEATEKQAYKAVCTLLRGLLASKRKKFRDSHRDAPQKQVYYMSMEFLVGTSLKNNLYNLGLEDAFREALSSRGFEIERLYALDPDAGLGNG